MKQKLLLPILLTALLLASALISGCTSSSDDDGSIWDDGTGTITGKVTDTGGNPLAGALCSVTTTDSRGQYTDTTDANGEYVLSEVPVGSWYLHITADGYIKQSQSVVVEDGLTTDMPDVQLSPGSYGTVTGTVTDNEQNQPIPGVTVTIGEETAITDSNGTYTITNAAAGEQTITAEANGYEPYHLTVQVVENQTVTHNITLTAVYGVAYGTVTGVVRNGSNPWNPIPGATVSIGGKTTTTGADGAYLLTNVPEGKQIVRARHADYDGYTGEVEVLPDQSLLFNITLRHC